MSQPDCACQCPSSYQQALANFHKFIRTYKENGRRAFIYVPGQGKKPGVWGYVAGLCYIASAQPERRELVIQELREFAEMLERHRAGVGANAAAIRAVVGELEAGKTFDQPQLLGDD